MHPTKGTFSALKYLIWQSRLNVPCSSNVLGPSEFQRENLELRLFDKFLAENFLFDLEAAIHEWLRLTTRLIELF